MTDDPNAKSYIDQHPLRMPGPDDPVTFMGHPYVRANLPSGAKVRGVSRMQPAHINALCIWFDQPPTEADITALHVRLIWAGAEQPARYTMPPGVPMSQAKLRDVKP